MKKLRISPPAMREFERLMGQYTCSGRELVTALAKRSYTKSEADSAGVIIQLGPRTRDLNFTVSQLTNRRLNDMAIEFLIVPKKTASSGDLSGCTVDAILTGRIVSDDPIDPRNETRLNGTHGIYLSDAAMNHLKQLHGTRRISTHLNEVADKGRTLEAVREMLNYDRIDRRLSMKPSTVLYFADQARIHDLPVVSRRSVISLASIGIEAYGQGALKQPPERTEGFES